MICMKCLLELEQNEMKSVKNGNPLNSGPNKKKLLVNQKRKPKYVGLQQRNLKKKIRKTLIEDFGE